MEDTSSVALYDSNMILLTCFRPLREATVEELFDKQNISVFMSIGDVGGVSSYTDASLLHSRRILYYRSAQCIPYEYNVDTRENKRIEVAQNVLSLIITRY